MNPRKLAVRLLDATRFCATSKGLTRQEPVPAKAGRRPSSRWVPTGEYEVAFNLGGKVFGSKEELEAQAAAINRDISTAVGAEAERALAVFKARLDKGEHVTSVDACQMVEAAENIESLQSLKCFVSRTEEGDGHIHYLHLGGLYLVTGPSALERSQVLGSALDAILLRVRLVSVKEILALIKADAP